jgi:hypothetical protein
VTWNFDIAAPRQTVWEHFTVPGQRQKWWPADGIVENSSRRRRGIGTENHCMHGKDAIVEEVLDINAIQSEGARQRILQFIDTATGGKPSSNKAPNTSRHMTLNRPTP